MSGSPRAIRLNLGCGSRPLTGYVNVDMDTLEQLRQRYPQAKFPEGVEVKQYDIFALPYEDGAVDEIRADSLIEHLSFSEEPRFFHEVTRVLRPGGVLILETPDFEQAVKDWLAAKDEWRDFYRSDPEAIEQCHWFGTYTYARENRWGYLSAMIFGPQNGEGQFHKNAYTEPKIRAILNRLGYQKVEIDRTRWKGDRDLILRIRAVKA
jgi:predicted SAM-dependent methyltransferase